MVGKKKGRVLACDEMSFEAVSSQDESVSRLRPSHSKTRFGPDAGRFAGRADDVVVTRAGWVMTDASEMGGAYFWGVLRPQKADVSRASLNPQKHRAAAQQWEKR